MANATYWFSSQLQLPWVEVESMVTKKYEHGFIFIDLYKNLKKDIKNQFVRNTLIVWNEAQRILGEVPSLSHFAPFGETRTLIQEKIIPVLNNGH